MKSFDLGAGVRCDLEKLVDSRLLIQANSGGGKSWAIRRLLEQTHGEVQHLVLDPEGEFSTLRERFDYVLAARQHGDTVADTRAATLLAERLLELGASAVLDIYELKAHDRIRFVRLFLEALVNARKQLWHPVLVVVDEAHVFCPEKGEAESAGAVIDLATRGRKRGFCAVLATQRLSKLNKDAAAECNNKLIGRTGLDIDQRRAADELGFGKERWRELRELPPGTFFAFGPALTGEVQRVHVGSVSTSHPKAGARLSAPPPPPTAKVRALLPKLADLPAEAEERSRSLKEVQQELATTRRELTLAKRAQPAPVQTAKPVEKRVEIGVLKEGQLKRLEGAIAGMAAAREREAGRMGELLRTFQERVTASDQQLATVCKELQASLTRFHTNGHFPPPPRLAANLQRPPAVLARPGPPIAGKSGPAPAGNLSSSQHRILNALAWLETIGKATADKTMLALMADASPTSGGYFNNLGVLRTTGLITYPSAGTVALTEVGRETAEPVDVPTTSEELHRMLFAKLSGSQQKVLAEVIRQYPDAIGKDDLAEAAGQSPTSGGYFNNLGRLRSLGLIDYPTPRQVVALPVLFLES